MKLHYHCEHCGAAIATLDMARVDEEELGFDCLTPEERQDIIKIDAETGTIYVQSLCDSCIETLGLREPEPLPIRRERVYIH